MNRILRRAMQDSDRYVIEMDYADALSIAVQHFRRTMRAGTYAEKHDAENMIRLDRSVRAIHELDRNANQATLIECYAADIAAGVTGERGGIG
jgi:DNA polymerase-3 subunit delta'